MINLEIEYGLESKIRSEEKVKDLAWTMGSAQTCYDNILKKIEEDPEDTEKSEYFNKPEKLIALIENEFKKELNKFSVTVICKSFEYISGPNGLILNLAAKVIV